MRKLVFLVVTSLLLLVGASAAFAAGPNVYPDGAEGFWVGAAPPPGLYYVNYDLWYSANKFMGNDGNEVHTGMMRGFEIDVVANVSRVLWMSQHNVLGGNWGMHTLIPVLDQKIKVSGARDSIYGLGDIIVDPFILAWHSPNLHVVTGLDIYLPTGRYKEGRLANLGCNAFVWEPLVGVTYLTPVKGLTASAMLRYDFPEANHDYAGPMGVGELQYGQELHVDYSLDYTLTQEWKAGIGGYFHKQITEDEINGTHIHNAKEQVFAIGPGVEYSKPPFFVQVRPQFEMFAKNKAEGISTWLRVTYIIPVKK